MKTTTPLKAIRTHCVECQGGSWAQVRECEIPGCPLFQYRFGRNPALKGKRGNSATLREYRHSFQKKAVSLHDSKEISEGAMV